MTKSPGDKDIFLSTITGLFLLLLASSLSVTPSMAQGEPSPQYLFCAKPGEYRKAVQRVYHSAGEPSFIELPLVTTP